MAIFINPAQARITATAKRKCFLRYQCVQCGKRAIYIHVIEMKGAASEHLWNDREKVKKEAASRAVKEVDRVDGITSVEVNQQHNYNSFRENVYCPCCGMRQPWSGEQGAEELKILESPEFVHPVYYNQTNIDILLKLIQEQTANADEILDHMKNGERGISIPELSIGEQGGSGENSFYEGYGEEGVMKENPDSFLDELREDIMRTQEPPEDPLQAWDWAMGRIRYYKLKNAPRHMLYPLEANMLLYLTDQYEKNFEEYCDLADDMSPAIMVCEDFLENHDSISAFRIIYPYFQLVDSWSDQFAGRAVCCQNPMEETLMREAFPDMAGLPRTKDNYTYLYVLYARVLYMLSYKSEEEKGKALEEIRRVMQAALKISPWNSSVWETYARTLSRDREREEEYMACMQWALRYAVFPGEPYGLGRIYANLAEHYAPENKELAGALCYAASKYGGDCTEAGAILEEKYGIKGSESEDLASCEKILREAGIQFGYSDIVKEMQP